jgi:hypothetical protein
MAVIRNMSAVRVLVFTYYYSDEVPGVWGWTVMAECTCLEAQEAYRKTLEAYLEAYLEADPDAYLDAYLEAYRKTLDARVAYREARMKCPVCGGGP